MTDTPKPDAESPLLGLTRLSEQVYFQESPAAAASLPSNPSDPTTVIIFGWGDAVPRHVSKYVAGYRELFPHTQIVLVFSPILQALYQGLETRTRNMDPVLNTVFPLLNPTEKATTPQQRVLLHVMSNTGGINCAAAMNNHAVRHGTPLPHLLMVLDSTPGGLDIRANIGRWSRAMALGAAKFFPWPFAVTQGLAAGFLFTNWGVGWMLGRTSAAEYSVAGVNDPTLADLKARRLYLYSKEDDIIFWEDIEIHAAQAKERGYAVDFEMFEGSAHVGHMRKHPEQYWAAIAKSWRDEVASEGKQ